jgi:HPt (histidine-containing phosphotransfer) domain-containing protein
MTSASALTASRPIADLPAGLTASAAAAGVELEVALNRLSGRRDVYRRMLGNFVTGLAALPAQLREPPIQGQPSPVARLLHSFKGLAATLGASALAAQAARAEKLLEVADAQGSQADAIECACAAIAAALPAVTALHRALLDDAQMPGAQSRAAPAGYDAAALDTALHLLAEQLRQADMAATQTMDALLQEFGDALEGRLQALDEAVGVLDFGQALQLSLALMESQAA